MQKNLKNAINFFFIIINFICDYKESSLTERDKESSIQKKKKLMGNSKLCLFFFFFWKSTELILTGSCSDTQRGALARCSSEIVNRFLFLTRFSF